jgi:hypothetical protein
MKGRPSHHEVALQRHQERLPLRGYAGTDCDDAELFHRRSKELASSESSPSPDKRINP